MTHLAVRRTSFRGTKLTETVADMCVSDVGETMVAMNVRGEINYKSEIVGSLMEGSKFTVVEVGESHRALVSSGNTTGWISTQTDLDQPLTRKVHSGAGALTECELLIALNLHQDQEFTSEVLEKLDAGTMCELIEEAPQNRFKIMVDGEIGWVTGKTDLDQPLVKKLPNSGDAPKMVKRLDTYVARVASRSQVTKVMSSKSLGSKSERVGQTRSTDNSESKQPTSDTATTRKRDPPKSAKLACCCG